MDGQAPIGNWFAISALLFLWPIVAALFFAKFPPEKAALWTMLGGYLLLPASFGIKPPFLPALDKNTVPTVCAIVGLMLRGRKFRSGLGLAGIALAAALSAPIITTLLNNDDIVVGGRDLAGVTLHDGISAFLAQGTLLMAFLVGRFSIVREKDIENTLKALALGGALYSLLALFEVRMSPQLSSWIYGYFPGGFNNEMRYGGFRPVVFQKNGLTLAFFLMTSFLSTLCILRVGERIGNVGAGFVSIFLAAVLLLCKSAGAAVYALCVGPCVWFLRPSAVGRISAVLVTVALVYPALRLARVFPDDYIVAVAKAVSEQRSESLAFRFSQEDKLLDRASERLLFGWGRYGRSRIYDEWGNDRSVTDGAWIQQLGQFGLFGFLSLFGLTAVVVFQATRVLRFVQTYKLSICAATLTVIVALALVEQLPNSSISAWNLFLAGALKGLADVVSRRRSKIGQAARHNGEVIRPPRLTTT